MPTRSAPPQSPASHAHPGAWLGTCPPRGPGHLLGCPRPLGTAALAGSAVPTNMLSLDALLLALMSTLLAGAWSHPGQDPAIRYVDGIAGRSVSLTAIIPPGKAVDEIEWEFCPERDLCHLIAYFIKGAGSGSQF
uniref:Uncharacterized protein n=1 Tax=Sphaerodactylus townsendi TaxID=933632 RepID=A0ACB8G7C5_9SAUR